MILTLVGDTVGDCVGEAVVFVEGLYECSVKLAEVRTFTVVSIIFFPTEW